MNTKSLAESASATERWERIIGSHRISFEPPDFLHVRISGDFDEETILELIGALWRLAEQLPFLVALVDLSAMGTITAGARKAASSKGSPSNAAVAVVGVDFHRRVLIDLIVKAAKLFKVETATVGMFEGEAEARAWFDEQRRAAARR